MKTVQDIIDRISNENIFVGTMFSLDLYFKKYYIDYLEDKCRKKVGDVFTEVPPSDMPLSKEQTGVIINGVNHTGSVLGIGRYGEILFQSQIKEDLYKLALVGDDLYIVKDCSKYTYEKMRLVSYEPIHEYINTPIPQHTVKLKTPSKKLVFANILDGEWQEPKNKHSSDMSVGNIIGNRNLRDWMAVNTNVGSVKTGNCSIYLWKSDKGIIGTEDNPQDYDWTDWVKGKYPIFGIEEDAQMFNLNQYILDNGYEYFGEVSCGTWVLEFTDLDNYKSNSGKTSFKNKDPKEYAVDGNEYIETKIPSTEIEYQSYWGETVGHQHKGICFQINFL